MHIVSNSAGVVRNVIQNLEEDVWVLVFWGGGLGNLGGRPHRGVGEEQDLQKVPDQGVCGGRQVWAHWLGAGV